MRLVSTNDFNGMMISPLTNTIHSPRRRVSYAHAQIEHRACDCAHAREN